MTGAKVAPPYIIKRNNLSFKAAERKACKTEGRCAKALSAI